MRKIYFYLCFALFLFGCATMKHIDNGNIMMSEKNYQRAASEYRAALRKSPNNTKALFGLQRASDNYINENLKKFDDHFNKREYVRAEETMAEILKFVDANAPFGIKTDVPQSALKKHESITNAIAEFYYRHGSKELQNGNFNAAINHFKKTQESDPDYKDVRSLIQRAESGIRNANAERYYQSGLRKYQAGNYREAYSDLSNCLSQVSGYKNAAAIQRSALDKGKVRIALFEFGNETHVHGASGTLYSYVISNIVNSKSPFIDLIDRQNLDRLLNEISFSHSGSVDASSAARAGKMLGLNYVVVGRVTNIMEEGGHILPKQFNAYELYHVTIDGKQVPKGRPVSFTLYEGTSKVTFEAQYQIVSVETGQIIKSNIVSSYDTDAVSYAHYHGDPSRLYLSDPGLASGGSNLANFLISAATAATMVNQNLFTARRNLRTPSEMQSNIMRDIAVKIAREITSEFD